jgi:hypothetical protein
VRENIYFPNWNSFLFESFIRKEDVLMTWPLCTPPFSGSAGCEFYCEWMKLGQNIIANSTERGRCEARSSPFYGTQS